MVAIPVSSGARIRRLVSDWNWRLFDEDLEGREVDFPALGWRRVWLEEQAPSITTEVREWYFGCDHPDTASAPALAWRAPSMLCTDPAEAPTWSSRPT